MEYSLEGIWKVQLQDGFCGNGTNSWRCTCQDGAANGDRFAMGCACGEMTLPGTLDENGIGYRDTGKNQWHPMDDPETRANGVDPAAPIATRFTRNYTFEGEARLTRRIHYTEKPGKRVFLEAERARVLRLLIDGQEVPHFIPPSISTPQIFEVTGKIDGEHEITLLSDNSYPGLPHDSIVYSSAATDETQTNWNGILGYLRLREEEEVFLQAVRIYPKIEAARAARFGCTIKIDICAAREYEGTLFLSSEAFVSSPVRVPVSVPAGNTELVIESAQTADLSLPRKPAEESGLCGVVIQAEELALSPEIRLWDEYEGNLYQLTVHVLDSLRESGQMTVRFGVRDFGDNGSGRFALNGRTIFLRSEANCAEFPEEGHPPMDRDTWLEILERYKSYGVNCMRFHSHCPPEAAFEAADELGMLMQPELSHWNPRTAFEDEESFSCYQTELIQILKTLANHPSFVMLTFGNELHANEQGIDRMHQLLALARETDGTRLYAIASNAFYGARGCDEESDFYTAQGFHDFPLRGTFAAEKKEEGIRGYINSRYPDACMNYDFTMKELRKTYAKPVFGFEAGQFETLPDFGELEDFHGISMPVNLELIQKKAEERGLIKSRAVQNPPAEEWNRYVAATGELALIGYREEIEAVMRTREMSGISLLGLQDFPGQGTALVGMMNSHLNPKPYPFASPERFQAFFRSQRILVELPRYTYESDEILTAKIKIANYGKREICGSVHYELRPEEKVQPSEIASRRAAPVENISSENILACGEFPRIQCPAGELTEAGELAVLLSFADRPMRVFLHVRIEEKEEVCFAGAASGRGAEPEDKNIKDALESVYPVWVYPPGAVTCPENVHETECFDDRAKTVLAKGGIVYLTPPATAEALPSSIKTQFTTDFWSVGTFPAQEGGMGQLIDAAHPLFDLFPTEFHTNWQWWPMATQRAIILPEYKKSIVAEMDSYAYMRPMTQLLECRCGGGRLLLSSMGLQNLQQYPEARALQRAIYHYLGSERFRPEQEMAPEEIAALVQD